WQQNLGPPFPTGYRRSHVPPITDSVYGGTGGSWLWIGDNTWQPSAPHVYTNHTTHPTLGLIALYKGPTNLIQPSTNNDSTDCLIAWNRSTGKWTALAKAPAGSNDLTISDWNCALGKLVKFDVPSSGDRTTVYEWSPGGSVTQVAVLGTAVGTWGSFTGFSMWMEADRYLLCKDNQP